MKHYENENYCGDEYPCDMIECTDGEYVLASEAEQRLKDAEREIAAANKYAHELIESGVVVQRKLDAAEQREEKLKEERNAMRRRAEAAEGDWQAAEQREERRYSQIYAHRQQASLVLRLLRWWSKP
jgi:hypothetical protein